MDEQLPLLIKYVNAATDLAEAVKRAIKKNGVIDDKTVLALNTFIIAANEISGLTEQLDKTSIKYNQ